MSFPNDPRVLNPIITPEMWAEAGEISNRATHENLTKEDIAQLIWAQYLYWRDAETPDAIWALGPLANLTASLAMGKPPETATPPQ